MVIQLISRFKSWVPRGWQRFQAATLRWPQPTKVSLVVGTIGDFPRNRTELMLENMLLRQQLIVLQRQVNRPAFIGRDRLSFVLLASRLRTWKQSLLIVQ